MPTLRETIGPEAITRLEAHQQALEATHTVVHAEYQAIPDYRPSISVAGYTDRNLVHWTPIKNLECTLTLPDCHNPSFLWSEGYGRWIVICEECFRKIIYEKPKHLMPKWLIAKAIEQSKLKRAAASAEWIMNHAYKHTARAAYRDTRN